LNVQGEEEELKPPQTFAQVIHIYSGKKSSQKAK